MRWSRVWSPRPSAIPAGRTVPVAVPQGIREIRVRPGGAILFGATRS